MDFERIDTVKVEFKTIEKLVRDSERLESIRKLLKQNDFVSTNDLKALLEIEEKAGESDGI